MLGQIIVKSLNSILNIVGWLVLIIASLAGFIAGWEGGFLMAILGLVFGFAVGFIWVTVVLGLLFLLLQINENLTRLNHTAEQIRDK